MKEILLTEKEMVFLVLLYSHEQAYIQLIEIVFRQNASKTDGETLCGGVYHQQDYKT